MLGDTSCRVVAGDVSEVGLTSNIPERNAITLQCNAYFQLYFPNTEQLRYRRNKQLGAVNL